MTWCEKQRQRLHFRAPGNVVLDRLVEPAADDIRGAGREPSRVLRGFAEARYAANRGTERRVWPGLRPAASHADDMLRRGIDIRLRRHLGLQGERMPEAYL